MKNTNKPKVYSIARSIGKLSQQWLGRNYLFRKKEIDRLVKKSFFSEKMAEALLDSLFKELTESKLLKLLKHEFRNPLVLDDFHQNKISRAWHRAHGPSVITHIFSGNVPNPAIVSLVFGMLVKSINLAKVSSRDEG